MKITYLLPILTALLIILFFLGLPDLKTVPLPRARDRRMTRRDALFVTLLTLIYAGVAFWNLGDTRAPQTVRSLDGESALIDLGGEETVSRVQIYTGIGQGSYTFELSPDGETWLAAASFEQGHAALLKWQELDLSSAPQTTARYLRITGSGPAELGEVAVYDENGLMLPITSGCPELCDEQELVPAEATYLNSSYFDEIYHARTAYELVHGLSIYEWTHPPLGKVLMSLGVRIFGMTPFGWRFMGALVGVMMLPLMYLLAMQLTKSTKLSAIAMCLLALDSMHFTQTRIATIDSYAVFWILLMYFFMIRAVQMDWRQVSLGRFLVPLGLCGVTMGVAIATKWIGAYAAVGLAVLLFWKLISEIARGGALRREAVRRSLWTVAFCLLFFVLIPLLIYYFSYTGQLKYEGVNGFGDMFSMERVRRVIELQESMLNYHAGLGGDTHYFRSPWYQWPVIWWPMWYYSGTPYLSAGTISSISCMGNPAVWWTGLVALLFILIASAWRRRAPKSWLIVLIGFASQFLPWVLVPRSTFIYHYFASVPFIILCTVLMLDELRKRSEKGFRWIACGLLALSLILFVAFYPLESGLPVSRNYAQYLRWFKWYNF